MFVYRRARRRSWKKEDVVRLLAPKKTKRKYRKVVELAKKNVLTVSMEAGEQSCTLTESLEQTVIKVE